MLEKRKVAGKDGERVLTKVAGRGVSNMICSYENEVRKIKNLVPEDIYQVFQKEGAILAGGAITSLFTGREINDLDLYFRSKESLLRVVKYIFKESNHALTCVNYTDKSILFTTGGEEGNRVDLQFIYFNYYEVPHEIFDSFDFTVCMGAYLFRTGSFYFHEDFMKHNSQRYLKYNPKTDYPLLSALRVDKYKEKGYTISKTEYLRTIMNAANLDINSWHELKEHIGGFYGHNIDNVFNEDREFSVEEAIDQLSEVSACFAKPQFKFTSYFELRQAILGGEPPRFFKWVREENGKYLSRCSWVITYDVGSWVNGGKMGIFCFAEGQEGPLCISGGLTLIEVKPEKPDNWELNGDYESQLYGDVYVVRKVPEEEFDEILEIGENPDLPF